MTMHLHLSVLSMCLAMTLAAQYEQIPGVGKYRYVMELKTWQNAKRACEAEGATLAVLNSEPEAKALKELIRRHPHSGSTVMAHIGFSDQDEEGKHMTVLGGTLSESGYTTWKYQPSNSPRNKNMKMDARFLILAVCVAASSAQNSQGYRVIEGVGTYRFSAEKKTWEEAKLDCEGDGAYLAIINSQEEANGLRNILLANPHSGVMAFIGFEDKENEGRYMTVKGNFLTSTGYNIWKNRPTKSAKNQVRDCGAMFNCGRLTDAKCSDKYPYFCELPPGEVDPE